MTLSDSRQSRDARHQACARSSWNYESRQNRV